MTAKKFLWKDSPIQDHDIEVLFKNNPILAALLNCRERNELSLNTEEEFKDLLAVAYFAGKNNSYADYRYEGLHFGHRHI